MIIYSTYKYAKLDKKKPQIFFPEACINQSYKVEKQNGTTAVPTATAPPPRQPSPRYHQDR